MSFIKISEEGVRNLEPLTFYPSPQLNFFTGENGAGKTSLLESICLLSTGRTFRNNYQQNYIAKDKEYCLSFGEWGHLDQIEKIGVKREKNKNIEIKLNGVKHQTFEQISHIFALKVLTPELFTLISGTADQRRNMIDWALFHVEQPFRKLKNTYSKILINRNSLLKNWRTEPEVNNLRAISYWDKILNEHSQKLINMRQNSVQQLQKNLHKMKGLPLESILKEDIKLKFQQGWPIESDLESCLKSSLEKDIKRGFTQFGAHRFDIRLYVNNQKASDILSRGEIKTLAIACQIIQIQMLIEKGLSVVVLVDDLFAELDPSHAIWCLEQLHRLEKAQKFITGVMIPEVIKQKYSSKGMQWFHVEHGKIVNSKKKPD